MLETICMPTMVRIEGERTTVENYNV